MPDDLRARNWVLQIAYPVHNIGPQIPLMLTTVNGNIASAGRLKLLDLNLPSPTPKGSRVQSSASRACASSWACPNGPCSFP